MTDRQTERQMDSFYPPEFGRRNTGGPTEQEIRATAREAFVRRALVFMVLFFLAVCTITTTVTVALVRNQQVDRAKVTDRIEDCTTPGRQCYDSGQDQLAKVIAGLNQYGIAVAACASGPVQLSDKQIIQCVVSKGLPAPKPNQIP